jgi:hypothetical protein
MCFKLTNWFVAIITPILLDKSAFGAYFLFGGLALGTVAILAAYMPETRGRSLESIQDAFHHPMPKSLTHYLQALIPKKRRPQNTRAPAQDPVEMGLWGSATCAATSSVEAVGRGLRLDASLA